MADMTNDGFYEDDEPVEKVVAAFKAAPKYVTAIRGHGINQYLSLPGNLSPAAGNEPQGELAAH